MLRNTQNKFSFVKKYSISLFKVHENIRAVKPSIPFDVTVETVPDEFQMEITDPLCKMDCERALQHIQIFTHQNHIAQSALPRFPHD